MGLDCPACEIATNPPSRLSDATLSAAPTKTFALDGAGDPLTAMPSKLLFATTPLIVPLTLPEGSTYSPAPPLSETMLSLIVKLAGVPGKRLMPALLKCRNTQRITSRVCPDLN